MQKRRAGEEGQAHGELGKNRMEGEGEVETMNGSCVFRGDSFRTRLRVLPWKRKRKCDDQTIWRWWRQFLTARREYGAGGAQGGGGDCAGGGCCGGVCSCGGTDGGKARDYF